MRLRIAAAILGAAVIGAPTVAIAKENEKGKAGYERAIAHALENGNYKPHEKQYLRWYDRFADEFGVSEAGRNVVIFGENPKDGSKHGKEPSQARVERSTEYFRNALNPPEVVPVESTTGATTAATSASAAAPTSVIECESGGDYGAVNPAGYYGAYQFDQQTWDAYAPSGYAGTNPASAPPAVQDQAAANVPYDAWPNC